LDIMNLQAL